MNELDDTTPLETNDDDQPDKAGYESGDNDDVSTEPFIHDPVLAKYQTEDYQAKWVEELESSRKERKEFVAKGYKILEHWADKRSTDSQVSNYNLLYANTELKQAALYANTPSPDVKRRFSDPNDQISRVASIILMRKLETELDEEDFDSTARQIITDRLLPGIGIGWLRFEQKGGDDYLPYAGQTIDDGTGNQVPHPLAAQVSQTAVTSQCAPVDHVSWDDFYWSPCRTWKLCRWVGRHIPMSKQAVKDRFGSCCPPETLALLSYEQQKNKKLNDKDHLRTKNQVESTTSIYEIWDKELKIVWWIAETADVPLDVQQDTNEFPGFFPTPRNPLGRFDGSNTIPHPDYHFAQDLYRLLDRQNDRLAKYIDAAQLKFVYDNANPELKDLLTTTSEFGGIGVNNWASFVTEKGGLKNAMQFLPIEDIVNAAQIMAKSMDLTKQQILQIEGLAGPFQGESVSNETTLQTQQKAAFGTSRLSITQKEVAKYIQELLRLKAHLICKFYTDSQILQGTGTLSPSDQKLIPQAIALLRNEQLRNFDLDVSVDSIQLPNWNLEKADKTEAFKALTQSMSMLLPVVQQNPAMAPLALTSLKWLISGFKGAQYIEGEVDAALTQLAQATQQKKQQPPQPTPDQIKAQSHAQRGQIDLQIAQMQEQTKRQLAQMQAQIDAQKLQIEQRGQAIDEQKLAIQSHQDAKDAIHQHAMDLSGGPTSDAPPVKGPDLTVVIGK